MVKNFVIGFNDQIFNKIPKSKMNAFFEVAEKVDLLIEEEMKKI